MTKELQDLFSGKKINNHVCKKWKKHIDDSIGGKGKTNEFCVVCNSVRKQTMKEKEEEAKTIYRSMTTEELKDSVDKLDNYNLLGAPKERYQEVYMNIKVIKFILRRREAGIE